MLNKVLLTMCILFLFLSEAEAEAKYSCYDKENDIIGYFLETEGFDFNDELVRNKLCDYLHAIASSESNLMNDRKNTYNAEGDIINSAKGFFQMTDSTFRWMKQKITNMGFQFDNHQQKNISLMSYKGQAQYAAMLLINRGNTREVMDAIIDGDQKKMYIFYCELFHTACEVTTVEYRLKVKYHLWKAS